MENKEPEYYRDEEFGSRLLISPEADKTELYDNVRCARTLLSTFPEMNIVVLDLDMHMFNQLLHPRQIAKHIVWRPDFTEEQIRLCYVVYRGRAVVVRHDQKECEEIITILEKLKAE